MTRWHGDEAEGSWLRHATEDAKSDDKGRRGREGRCSRTDTAVDECRNEMVDVPVRIIVEPELLQPPSPSSFVWFSLICSREGGARQRQQRHLAPSPTRAGIRWQMV